MLAPGQRVAVGRGRRLSACAASNRRAAVDRPSNPGARCTDPAGWTSARSETASRSSLGVPRDPVAGCQREPRAHPRRRRAPRSAERHGDGSRRKRPLRTTPDDPAERRGTARGAGNRPRAWRRRSAPGAAGPRFGRDHRPLHGARGPSTAPPPRAAAPVRSRSEPAPVSAPRPRRGDRCRTSPRQRRARTRPAGARSAGHSGPSRS